jgi:hypothetical protein
MVEAKRAGRHSLPFPLAHALHFEASNFAMIRYRSGAGWRRGRSNSGAFCISPQTLQDAASGFFAAPSPSINSEKGMT